MYGRPNSSLNLQYDILRVNPAFIFFNTVTEKTFYPTGIFLEISTYFCIFFTGEPKLYCEVLSWAVPWIWYYPYKSEVLCVLLCDFLTQNAAFWINEQATFPEAEFSDEIQTKVWRVFLLAISESPLQLSIEISVLQTHATSYSFYTA